jgi:hypothetical protein
MIPTDKICKFKAFDCCWMQSRKTRRFCINTGSLPRRNSSHIQLSHHSYHATKTFFLVSSITTTLHPFLQSCISPTTASAPSSPSYSSLPSSRQIHSHPTLFTSALFSPWAAALPSELLPQLVSVILLPPSSLVNAEPVLAHLSLGSTHPAHAQVILPTAQLPATPKPTA